MGLAGLTTQRTGKALFFKPTLSSSYKSYSLETCTATKRVLPRKKIENSFLVDIPKHNNIIITQLKKTTYEEIISIVKNQTENQI